MWKNIGRVKEDNGPIQDSGESKLAKNLIKKYNGDYKKAAKEADEIRKLTPLMSPLWKSMKNVIDIILKIGNTSNGEENISNQIKPVDEKKAEKTKSGKKVVS